MKERIVLATGAGGNDLLKSLALHGANCFNLRIFSSIDLAKYVLTKSGVTVKEGFINHTEENVYIVKALSGISYFGKVTYNDVCQIASAIRQIRGLVEDEAAIRPILEKGLFKEKNEALCAVCEKYLDLIRQDEVLDGISYLRLALSNATEIDAEFITIKEFPPTALEQALLNKISGGNVQNISIQELFGVEEKDIHVEDIKKCYGAPNEVETLLTTIYSEKQLDQCTIAITDPSTYSQLFFDYALLYDIPVTFGCGVPIMNANPAKLLVLYYHWITGGFFGVDALNTMLNSECFDLNKLYKEFPEMDESFKRSTFREVLGDICFTNDGAKNEERLSNFIRSLNEDKAFYGEDSKEYKKLLEKEVCISALEVTAKEFALPVEEFVTKYAYIRTFGNSNAENMLRNIDFSANDVIYNELKAIRYSGIDQSTDDIIKSVLGHNVCIQKMMEGALHVTLINKAFSSLRKNMYIAGLSALKFPGSPTENYLLLDVDLSLFGEKAERYSSKGRILAKKELLSSLVGLASSVESNISLSYAGLNVSELKRENASSVIFELFRKEHGANATSKELEDHIKSIAYFEPKISATREIGLAYNDGKDILQSFVPASPIEDTIIGDLTKYYSPSALSNYFSCPRLFLLANLLGIPQPQESDPFEVIPANDLGTLAHSLMERLANNAMSEEAFLKLSAELFDRYLQQHPPLLNTNAMAQRAAFLDMMQNAYQTDPKREVVLAEEDIYCSHESGINIHGFPDRVEKLDDGTYLVVDYKTGGNIRHVADDVASCMQVVLYAYLLEHRTENPLTISGAEFRYIRRGEVVPCKYDDEVKAGLNQLLNTFKEGMKSGEFPLSDPTTDDSPCKYCKYAAICGLF